MKDDFIRDGIRGRLTVKDFVPATNIGKFDLKVSPHNKKITVIIKVFYRFIDNTQDQLSWTMTQKNEFKRNARRVILEKWSNMYKIRCTKQNWEEFVMDIDFVIAEVSNPAYCRYVIEVGKLARYKSSGGINHGVVPHVCGVNNFANDVDITKNQEQIFNYKEGLIRSGLRGLLPAGDGDYLTFSSNQHVVAPSMKTYLDRFLSIARLRRTPDVQGIKAYVIGLKGKNDSMFTNNLESKRATAIANYINQRIVGDNFAIVSDTSAQWAKDAVNFLKSRARNHTVSGQDGGALIVIRTPANIERTVPHKYVVMTHEFGHMLGLPDEYMGIHSASTLSKIQLDRVWPATLASTIVSTGNNRLRLMQDGYTQMTTQANVPLPNLISTKIATKKPELIHSGQKVKEKNDQHSLRKQQLKDKFGQDSWIYKKYKNAHPYIFAPPAIKAISNSIMHSGSDIQKAHFVTIWSALCHATSDHLQCTDWEIIPANG
ncbi:hypothetical protein PCIT_a2832 [Pseudoalteromonas citrea]|uniref:Uncharacterized protein n=2 Tax=Pseudoalteromonas citrea TaxID=43655 RepID=A0AAD4AHP2_9GAMM|nr:hypothetical protein [Pseudoalteromonas citrea]KAF7769908.1 hypothetical protein PCIT_a2832 [Pseudoalteromonas citrea]